MICSAPSTDGHSSAHLPSSSIMMLALVLLVYCAISTVNQSPCWLNIHMRRVDISRRYLPAACYRLVYSVLSVQDKEYILSASVDICRGDVTQLLSCSLSDLITGLVCRCSCCSYIPGVFDISRLPHSLPWRSSLATRPSVCLRPWLSYLALHGAGGL